MDSILIILLIIWLIIIQNKILELSNSLKEMKNDLLKKSILNKEPPAKVHTEPLSITDIPDDIIYAAKKEIIPEKQPTVEKQVAPNNLDKPSSDFEKIFLGNIFTKIGALAVLIGIIIFIKLISPFVIFTPAVKITLGFLTGFGLIIGALKLHTKENMQNYSEVLLGTGFGALFISTYCASALFGLFNLPITFTVATTLLLAAFYLADRLKTVSMLTVSLVAGYLNPFFINPEISVSPNFLMGYLIFVNLLSIVYTYRNKSLNTVNTINIWLTCLTALFYFKGNNIIAPAILWATYFLYDLLSTIKQTDKNNKPLNYSNLAVFVILALTVYTHDNTAIAVTMLIIGILYGTAAFIKKDDELKTYINMFLVALNLSVFYITKESLHMRLILWSVEAVILSYCAYRLKYKTLAVWASGLWAAAFVALLFIDNVIYAKDIAKFKPIWNMRLATFAPLIISAGLSSFILSKTEDTFKNLSNMFRFKTVTLAYLYLGFEANDILNKYLTNANTSVVFMKNMTNAILGFVYTINLKKLYNSTKFEVFNFASAFIGICTLIYLLLTGTDYKPTSAFIPVINIRFAAFMAGIVTFALYARWTKQEVYKYIGVTLGFLLIHIEISNLLDKFTMLQAEYLISLSWILYAGIVTAVGIFTDKKFLKLSGIGLCILAISRIFFYDLIHVDILYKFIAFLTLGTILLVLSYFYNKLRK